MYVLQPDRIFVFCVATKILLHIFNNWNIMWNLTINICSCCLNLNFLSTLMVHKLVNLRVHMNNNNQTSIHSSRNIFYLKLNETLTLNYSSTHLFSCHNFDLGLERLRFSVRLMNMSGCNSCSYIMSPPWCDVVPY